MITVDQVPIIINIILFLIIIICLEVAVDYILCCLPISWHSPMGLKGRSKRK